MKHSINTVKVRTAQVLLNAGLVLLVMLATMVTGYAESRTTYFHNDALGSPVVATGETGVVRWGQSYTPYGKKWVSIRQSLNNEHWYTGHRYDDKLDLIDAGARFYDPETGRFLSIDPEPVNEENPRSFNRYSYSLNNPYAYRDPSGEIAETAFDIVSVGLSFDAFAKNPGVANGLGLVYDFVAAAVPLLPGGVGIVRKAATSADTLKEGSHIKEGVYEFTDRVTGKPYVGQSKNISKRLKQHDKSGRIAPGSQVKRTEVAGGKTTREVAEHRRIQNITGGVPARRSPKIANKRDPVGPKRQHLLQKKK